MLEGIRKIKEVFTQ
jgi:hypothetical protein